MEQITVRKDLKSETESLTFFSPEEIIDYSSCIDLRKRSICGIQQDVSLRGSNFEDVSINIQGVGINDPQTGHYNLELPFTSADLGQVEIFKNTQEVNYILKRPESEGWLLKSSFGRHALWEELLSANFPLGEAKNRFSAEHKTSKGERQDTDFEIYNFSFHSLWEGEYREAEFLFGSTSRDFGADSFYSSSYPHEEEHVNQRFFSIRAKLKEEAFDVNNIIYLRRHADKYILNRYNPSFYTNYHTTYDYGLKTRVDFDNDVFLSFDIEREEIDSTQLNEHKRVKKGITLGMRDKRFGDFILNLSGGLDYYEEWEYLENLHAGLGYFLEEDLKLSFSFDRLWRAPSFTELYYNSPANRGNSGLSVQETDNFEVGFDLFPNNYFMLGLGLFLRDQKDTIDWVKDTSLNPWDAKNVGDLEAYGVDFYSKIDINKGLFNKLSLEYTYLELNKDNPYVFSKYVFDYDRHKAVGMLEFYFNEVSLNLIGNFSKPVDRKKYITFDLKAKRQIAGFKLELEGINIFNKDYEEMQDIDGCGRMLKISALYSF